MSNSRTKSSIINISANIANQVIALLLSFASRTVFVKLLGEQYLGINGLFTNILSVLSLAELGVGTAIIYSMYKPVAENDENKISQLMNYYKKLYNRIALAVTIIGVSLLPFLKYLVKLDEPIENLHIYYLLFLCNTIISYLFVYKTSIIVVYQKDYITKIYNFIFNVIMFVSQIVVLIVSNNYYVYLIVGILCGLANNYFCARKADKMYPFINNKVELPNDEKITIWGNIKSMFFYKVGGVILNNTDNILISSMVSTAMVGFCSNYTMIVEALKKITSLFFTSIQASVGNMNAENNSEKQYKIFNILDMCSFWIYGFTSICICVLLQDFIYLWLGNKFVLSDSIVYIVTINYYLTGVLYPIWNYRETIGLFNDTKYIMFFAAFLNLIFSIIGGYYYGVFGILLATALARLLTNLWYEPYKLFKIYFKKDVFKYYLKQIIHVALIIIITIIVKKIVSFIYINNIYISFLVKGIVSVIATNCLFLILLFKTKEFKLLKEKLINQIKK